MRLVRSIVLVVCGVMLASLPATAGAEVRRHRDPAADVARSPIGSNAYAAAPTQAQGDIVAIRVTHALRAVWIRVRMRELTTSTNGNFHLIGIKSDRRERTIEIDAFPGHWEGRATTTDPRGRVVACAVKHRLDYDRNRLTVRVPRGCLGKPSWVRVGLRTTIAGATYAYVDDARATGFHTALVYGRRVRH